MRYRIHAFLKTKSPLHIAAPSSMRFDPATGQTMYGTGGVPCTAVQKMPIPHGAKGETRDYPVIAANNLACRLRRHGARLVTDVLKSKGQKISMTTYSVLQSGTATGNPDAGETTYGEYKRARAHPYLGLFGGGPKMNRRGFEFHNALPITDTTRDLGGDLMHPAASHYAINDNFRLTHVWGFRRLDDLRDLVEIGHAEEVIENFGKEFEKRQEQIISEVAAKKEGETGNLRTSTKAYNALEFIIPGTVFNICAEFDVEKAHMGLFLLSLDSFAARERLGGWVRNGFGVFSLEDVRLVDEHGAEHDGLFNNSRLITDHEAVAPYLNAWYTAARDLDAAELEALLRFTPKEKKKVA